MCSLSLLIHGWKQRLLARNGERTWTFFWADGAATDSHDMNWWFPTSEANNSAYANTGKTAPFYVWGTSGWGGQLSGLERSDGGSSLAAAPATAAGVPHTATYYALNGTQYFILDGAQIDSTLPVQRIMLLYHPTTQKEATLARRAPLSALMTSFLSSRVSIIQVEYRLGRPHKPF